MFLILLLIFAPLLLSPIVYAGPDPGTATLSIIPMAIQWGVGGVMFAVWVREFRRSKKRDEMNADLIRMHLEESNKTMALAFDKYDRHIDMMMQIQRDSHEQNLLLAGTLSRLEVKLSIPVKCPFGELSGLRKELQG